MKSKATNEVRSFLRDLSSAIKEYEQADNVRMNTRNNRDYEDSVLTQKAAYSDMMSAMEGLLAEIDALGLWAEAIDTHIYHIIEEKKM